MLLLLLLLDLLFLWLPLGRYLCVARLQTELDELHELFQHPVIIIIVGVVGVVVVLWVGGMR